MGRSSNGQMDLGTVVEVLGQIAPLELAASWDNVGLLVEPLGSRPIRHVFLTIDLTESVFDEAARAKADLIVSYHPPVFKALKRFATQDAEAMVVRRALAEGIAIYSPHTALDAVPGGIDDWLLGAFGPGRSRSLVPHAERDLDAEYKVVTFLPAEHVERLRDALDAEGICGVIGEYRKCSYEIAGHGTFQGSEHANPVIGRAGQFERAEEVRLEMVCRGGAALGRLSQVLEAVHPYETPAWDLYRLEPKPRPDAGHGRMMELARPLRLQVLLDGIKKHLGLAHVRLASAPAHAAGGKIGSAAVCAGAGGSVLEGVRADLFLTGEMRHHDVLAANARGTSVVLTEHTNTERGYLPTLRESILGRTRGVKVSISRKDRDPLRVV